MRINKGIKIKLIFIMIVIVTSFCVIIYNLINIVYKNNDKYVKLYDIKTNMVYISKYAPRGNIYDRNGELLVGNKEIDIIKYTKTDLNELEEINLAKRVVEYIEIDYDNVTMNELKEYYYILNKEQIESLLNEDVKKAYYENKITKEKYESILLSKIKEEYLIHMSETNKKAAYLYSLMNKGYTNEDKIIKNSNVSEEEINIINKKFNENFYVSKRYERYYPYGQTLRSIFGNVRSIPENEVEKYLKLGYRLDDKVGVSFLEKQYEEYLKGINETYKIDGNGKKVYLTTVVPGNDLYLTIDIKLQLEVENIIKEALIKAKKQLNTEYYNQVYAIVGDAKSGEIYAFASKKILDNGKAYSFVNTEEYLISDAVTPGSVVKGASHLVGYNTGSLKIGYKVEDDCIYIKNTPKKCSWRKLGVINDLDALKYSSNYYQFLIAINIGNGKYYKNQSLSLDLEAFNTYRKVYNEFGLGVKTGIDLPYESVGFKGLDTNSGSLLDFPIGQYDTYTPIQLFQYISTISNDGIRVAPHLMLNIKENGKVVEEYDTIVLNKVDTKEEYMKRVQTGFKMVMESDGTGSGYVNTKYDPYGKTGTAQSFLDTNNDGMIDTETITTNFVGYAKGVSFVVSSPHVSSLKTDYYSRINRIISRNITDTYFESYYNGD